MKKLFFFVIATFVVLMAQAQDQIVYQSKNLPTPDTVWVFKPKNYNAKQKLPLIYLLHGYSGSYKQWHSIMDAQKYADEYGFIIVCPDGLFSSWYLNSPVNPKRQYESFFFNELFPDILKKYSPNEQKIMITGLSMGGHGAMHLFIAHPELFISAGSTSGGIKLSDGYGKWQLADLLGNPSKEDPVWKQFSVIDNIDKLKGLNKSFIFDCGSGDFFYQSNNELKQKCDSLGLKATYISQPGAHNKAYWAKSIKQQFEFFKTLLME